MDRDRLRRAVFAASGLSWTVGFGWAYALLRPSLERFDALQAAGGYALAINLSAVAIAAALAYVLTPPR